MQLCCILLPYLCHQNSKDMKYSEDFKNMVKAHQGKFIGYGNPNAKVLIIVPKIDDERLDTYNGSNAEQWLVNIENQTDFDDVKDFFVDGEQVGEESIFNPLYPFKGMRDVLQKDKIGTIINNDGTCLSWHRYQDLYSEFQWDVTDKIDFFKYAFYTIFDEELLKDVFFQNFRLYQYSYSSKKHLLKHNPGKLFDMMAEWGDIEPNNKRNIFLFTRRNWDSGQFAKMVVCRPYEKESSKTLKENKRFLKIFIYSMYCGLPIEETNAKDYIDLLASGKICNNVKKKKMFEKILNNIQANIDHDYKQWAHVWVYAFQKLKENTLFYFSAKSKTSRRDIYTALPLVFVASSPKIVREIVSYIINVDNDYWYILTRILDNCNFYWNDRTGKNAKLYIPKNVYNELMSVFEEIDNNEYRTVLTGKLLWLKYQYRRDFGKKFKY